MKPFIINDPYRQKIIDLLNCMGRKALFRYCRDFGLYETVRDLLPGKLWDRDHADEDVLRKHMLSVWDDFSDNKYKEMMDWMKGTPLKMQMLGYASFLNQQSELPLAKAVLDIVKSL
jgi:hypothetical protein